MNKFSVSCSNKPQSQILNLDLVIRSVSFTKPGQTR